MRLPFRRTTKQHAPRMHDLRELRRMAFLKELVGGIGSQHLSAYAAALAYGGVFAIIPLIAVLVTMLGLFNATTLVDRAVNDLRGVVPGDVLALLDTQLSQVASTDQQGALGIGAVISVLVALWGLSGAMRRMMEALNVVEGSDPDPRPFVRRYAVSIGLALGAVLLIIAALLVIVVGGGIADSLFSFVGLGDTAATVWNILRWPAFLLLALVGIGLLYRVGSGTRTYGNVITPGALFATVGWVTFSALFSWYVQSLGSFDAAWGAVAGVVVFLLYMQYTGMILLVGALLDARLKRH